MRSFKDLREKTLTPAEKKKREEIAKAMERENPGMDMKKKMAIATWQAKKVAEEKDPNEYDKEGEMMKNQLRQICSANEKLMKMVGDDDNLPEWVQNKVTKATDYIRSVRDYLEAENGDEEEMDEAVRKGAPKMQGDFLKKERERNRAHDAAMGRTPTGRKKPVRTMTSTQRSLAKLRNEETQLDEISKKTLGSYVKKASADVANRSADNARDYATGNRPVGANKKAMKNMKRTQYVNKAVDKMTQETVQSADKKPEKFVKPDGKVGIRMVRVDKKVVDKDA